MIRRSVFINKAAINNISNVSVDINKEKVSFLHIKMIEFSQNNKFSFSDRK